MMMMIMMMISMMC